MRSVEYVLPSVSTVVEPTDLRGLTLIFCTFMVFVITIVRQCLKVKFKVSPRPLIEAVCFLLLTASCTVDVTSSLNESLNLLLGNDSVADNVTAARKTSPTDEYFRYLCTTNLPSHVTLGGAYDGGGALFSVDRRGQVICCSGR